MVVGAKVLPSTFLHLASFNVLANEWGICERAGVVALVLQC